jgi:hypothetical protein
MTQNSGFAIFLFMIRTLLALMLITLGLRIT